MPDQTPAVADTVNRHFAAIQQADREALRGVWDLRAGTVNRIESVLTWKGIRFSELLTLELGDAGWALQTKTYSIIEAAPGPEQKHRLLSRL